MIEMRLDEVKKNPQMFMYIFLKTPKGEKFLAQIDKKHRAIVYAKALNQIQVLRLSAEKYNETFETYANTVNDAFHEAFGMSPLKAMMKLAAGETVAGKNWAAGVYGVGAIGFQEGFKGSPNVTVHSQSGKILKNGVEQPNQTVVYSEKCPNNIQGYSCVIDGVTYTSQYYKVKKKYGAGMYENAKGKFKANGLAATSADLSSVWEGVELLWNKFVDWLISLFSSTRSDGEKTEMLSPENTLPSQTGDGFVSKSSIVDVLQSNSGLILLALGAGTLLATGNLPGLGKKGKKKNRK